VQQEWLPHRANDLTTQGWCDRHDNITDKWIIPFDEFAEDFLQHLWGNYFRKYLVSEKTAGNTVGTKISRNQEIWESLYISAQSYLNQYLMKMVNSGKQEEESKVTQGTKGRLQAGKK
jgi:hypothetical protein